MHPILTSRAGYTLPYPQRAHYALQRQQQAVMRILAARSVLERAAAARWAHAWAQLVQRQLHCGGQFPVRMASASATANRQRLH